MVYITALELNISDKDYQRVQRDERDEWFDFSQSKFDDLAALEEFATLVEDLGGDLLPSDPRKRDRINELLAQFEANKALRQRIIDEYYQK